MIDEAELWKRWQGPARIFLLSGIKDADSMRTAKDRPFFLIAQNKNTVILSNKEANP
jgi:hypothetical protein